MHKLVIVIVAAVIVFVSLGVVPQQAEAHTGYWQVNGGLGLNLRTGPGGSYQRLYTMPNGRIVKARGHRGNWMYLRDTVTGTSGWASLNYLVPYSGASGGGGTTTTQPALQLCFFNYWGQTDCAPYWIALEFYNAANYYGASYWWLMSVAACESDFSPNAYNPASGVTGIMQFMPSTITAFGWPGANPWSVHDSAWVAAKMFAQGLGYQHWHCYRLIAGG